MVVVVVFILKVEGRPGAQLGTHCWCQCDDMCMCCINVGG